ncbi:MAG: SRPBCC domain-containing protein [Usitatibacter sp.]
MSEPLHDLVHSIDIQAPRATVWDVMTGMDSVPQWLGCMNYAAKAGATFHMQPDHARRAAGDITGATWCDLEELRKPELLRFSWYMPGTPKTIVTIELEEVDTGTTRATLTHSGWDQFPVQMVQAIHAMLDGGWKSFVLPGLKAASEAALAAGR